MSVRASVQAIRMYRPSMGLGLAEECDAVNTRASCAAVVKNCWLPSMDCCRSSSIRRLAICARYMNECTSRESW